MYAGQDQSIDWFTDVDIQYLHAGCCYIEKSKDMWRSVVLVKFLQGQPCGLRYNGIIQAFCSWTVGASIYYSSSCHCESILQSITPTDKDEGIIQNKATSLQSKLLSVCIRHHYLFSFSTISCINVREVNAVTAHLVEWCSCNSQLWWSSEGKPMRHTSRTPKGVYHMCFIVFDYKKSMKFWWSSLQSRAHTGRLPIPFTAQDFQLLLLITWHSVSRTSIVRWKWFTPSAFDRRKETTMEEYLKESSFIMLSSLHVFSDFITQKPWTCIWLKKSQKSTYFHI